MISKKRTIASALKAVKQDVPAMPWARGARRAAFIAKRKAGANKQAA